MPLEIVRNNIKMQNREVPSSNSASFYGYRPGCFPACEWRGSDRPRCRAWRCPACAFPFWTAFRRECIFPYAFLLPRLRLSYQKSRNVSNKQLVNPKDRMARDCACDPGPVTVFMAFPLVKKDYWLWCKVRVKTFLRFWDGLFQDIGVVGFHIGYTEQGFHFHCGRIRIVTFHCEEIAFLK